MLEKISHFYLSKKTFIIAIIATMILEPIGMVMELTIDDLIPFEVIAYGIVYLLLIGLCIAHHKQDHILINGLVSGILIYEFVHYVYLITYFTDDESLPILRSMGFIGCFALGIVFTAIAIVFLITYNHFTLNRSRSVNRTKIVLNQFLLFLSFFVPILIAMMSFIFGYSAYETVTYAIIYFADAFLLLVVACCELELAINRKDNIDLEAINLSDVRNTLWYALSFLFSLFGLSMAILMPNIKPYFYWLNGLNAILSLGLLIYTLNRKKKPSKKGQTLLYFLFFITVAATIFQIIFYISTLL